MSDISEIDPRVYKEIWDQSTPRNSCIIPERAATISWETAYDLQRIACSVYRFIENTYDFVNNADVGENTSLLASLAQATFSKNSFLCKQLKVPPAVRCDVVIDPANKPWLIEIDPSTWLSLGETALLGETVATDNVVGCELVTLADARIKQMGVSGVASVMTADELPYRRELDAYMQRLSIGQTRVEEVGVYSRFRPGNDEALLGVPQGSKFIDQDSLEAGRVLWQPTTFGDKRILAALSQMSIQQMGEFDLRDLQVLQFAIPPSYFGTQGSELPKGNWIRKPIQGKGSSGIALVEQPNNEKDVIWQQAIQPRRDEYKVTDTINPDSGWATRYSIYACRTGIAAMQATARPMRNGFNNVHGQSDAIQSPVVVNY